VTLRRAADPAAALRMLRRVEPYGDGTAAQMAAGCLLLDVVERDKPVGAVAVELVPPVATIKAAAVASARVWAEHLPELEAGLRMAGVEWVGAFTKRAGLVRRMTARGYVAEAPGADGFTELRKRLH
jgi:hypothetical protein